MGLFRKEAIEAEKQKWLGEVILTTPMKLRIFSILTGVVILVILLFFVLFSYTRKQTVTGYLVPDKGIMKIYSPQYGVIKNKYVEEGQFIKQGEPLFVISSERESSNSSATQQNISEHIRARLSSLQNDLQKLDEKFNSENTTLKSYINRLKQQIVSLNSQIENQKQISKLVARRQEQYQSIYEKEYISLEQLERVKEEHLSQLSALQAYERERINIEKELLNYQSDLDGLTLKFNTQRAQIKRNISTTEQELTESEAKREIIIQAPQSGTVTAITGQVGQFFDGKRPLLSIIPENSMMIAHLYAPSNAVGFIQEGASVWLRYQSYPYQKFGQYHGHVESISKTALIPSELADQFNQSSGETSLYVITVKPDKQSILVYGKEKVLQPGMQLEADITLDRRKLYEWAFEPLFSITGKVTE